MHQGSLLLLGVISFKQTLRLAKRSAIRSLVSLDSRHTPGIAVRFVMPLHDVIPAIRTREMLRYHAHAQSLLGRLTRTLVLVTYGSVAHLPAPGLSGRPLSSMDDLASFFCRMPSSARRLP